MKSMKLNTSAKYKNNKFQIKYLKAKKNDIILFATYSATWNEEDNAFYRAYDFFIYFNRNKRAVCYIGNNCEQRSRANNTWRDNIRNLLTGKFKYYKMTVNKWITYKCTCGCNTFYIYKDWFVCSECFSEHIMNNFAITYKTKEDAEKVIMPTTGTIGMNTWHRFGIISKYEFDKFMKNCTNPEQVVYW